MAPESITHDGVNDEDVEAICTVPLVEQDAMPGACDGIVPSNACKRLLEA